MEYAESLERMAAERDVGVNNLARELLKQMLEPHSDEFAELPGHTVGHLEESLSTGLSTRFSMDQNTPQCDERESKRQAQLPFDQFDAAIIADMAERLEMLEKQNEIARIRFKSAVNLLLVHAGSVPKEVAIEWVERTL